jgi:thioredoxin-dependent peroxiredoxin
MFYIQETRRYYMATITFKGNPIQTNGELPAVGSTAPNFSLTATDLSDVTLENYRGKKLILNIFPSIDTAVCATSVRKFNAEASNFDNTLVLCISDDLPFAQKRFCGAEGLERVVSLSEMKHREFGKDYGVRMVDGPLSGLLARAIVVLDESGKVIYNQMVPEITKEPDYVKAIESIR